MILLPLSFIISHGLLDPLSFQKRNNIIYYIYSIILFTFLYKVFTNFVFSGFLLMSMYHFGEDIRYLLKSKHKNYRFSGMLLISSTYGPLNWEINTINWIKGLSLIGIKISNNLNYIIHLQDFLFLSFLFSSCVILFTVDYRLIIINSLFFALTNFYNPLEVIVIYMTLIHVPMALLRYKKEYGLYPTFFCILLTLPIYICIKKINYNIDYSVIISIVITHMNFITLWQNKKN